MKKVKDYFFLAFIFPFLLLYLVPSRARLRFTPADLRFTPRISHVPKAYPANVDERSESLHWRGSRFIESVYLLVSPVGIEPTSRA